MFLLQWIPSDYDDSNFMAMAIYGEYWRLAYYNIGYNKWTDITTTELWYCYEDAIFYEGKLYAVNQKAQLCEYDMNTGLRGFDIAQPLHGLNIGNNSTENPKYLVALPNGLPMIVRRLKSKYIIHDDEGISQGDGPLDLRYINWKMVVGEQFGKSCNTFGT